MLQSEEGDSQCPQEALRMASNVFPIQHLRQHANQNSSQIQAKSKKSLKRKREKIQLRALEATSTSTSTKCTLAKIISVQSGELLRCWVISLISSKMLPTNLIQLDNPPEIKFCAFYKVCHKKFKKLLNIKNFSPNSRLD